MLTDTDYDVLCIRRDPQIRCGHYDGCLGLGKYGDV